jgi:hypothetical protein
MFSQTNRKLIPGGHGRILLLSFLLIAALGFAQTGVVSAFQSPQAVPEDRAASDIQKKLKTASMQHELILLLIENKTFDQVEIEWKKVLDLRLGAKYEGAIAQSLLTIGYKLYEAKQFPLGQKIMDASIATVPFINKDKADIYKFKALLFREMGDIDSAIRCMRLASELADK